MALDQQVTATIQTPAITMVVTSPRVVPVRAPSPTRARAGSDNSMATSPMPPLTIRFSPQVRFNRAVERLTASPTPTPSNTRIGSTKNVTTAQAMPTMPTTMRPSRPDRSEMDRRITDTVALSTAHGRIRPARSPAADRALPSVGFPPRMRSSAPHNSAVLK